MHMSGLCFVYVIYVGIYVSFMLAYVTYVIILCNKILFI